LSNVNEFWRPLYWRWRSRPPLNVVTSVQKFTASNTTKD
jgi:hypothetical protein